MMIPFKNTELYYKSKGTGNPIVFLHGFLESSKIWNPFVPELSLKRQVITVDLPGHGRSGVVGAVHPMEVMAEAVHHVLKHLEVEQAAIVGHSMGGYVALAFCEKFPEMVKSITLMNSTPAEDTEERKNNRERAIELVKKSKKTYISLAISNLLPRDNDLKFARELTALKEEAQTFSEKGIIAALKGMKIRTDKKSVLQNFPGEKYMILGLKDTVLEFESATIMG